MPSSDVIKFDRFLIATIGMAAANGDGAVVVSEGIGYSGDGMNAIGIG